MGSCRDGGITTELAQDDFLATGKGTLQILNE
jgi:hypothetical protein